MQSYYILSGEGEIGTWKRVETASIKESLRDERQGGDRWLAVHGTIHPMLGDWARKESGAV